MAKALAGSGKYFAGTWLLEKQTGGSPFQTGIAHRPSPARSAKFSRGGPASGTPPKPLRITAAFQPQRGSYVVHDDAGSVQGFAPSVHWPDRHSRGDSDCEPPDA